jgi:hypothetical protein
MSINDGTCLILCIIFVLDFIRRLSILIKTPKFRRLFYCRLRVEVDESDQFKKYRGFNLKKLFWRCVNSLEQWRKTVVRIF